MQLIMFRSLEWHVEFSVHSSSGLIPVHQPLMTRAARKSWCQGHHEYCNFGHVPCFSAITVILCHSRDYYNYYYCHFTAPWAVSGTTQVSWYQKGKSNLDLLEQEIVSARGVSWAICKSAPRPRQITMPGSHHSVFTGRMPFLLPNQQHQST